jgi:UDP-N-acetyl-D-galactosamine dehydrogenase
MKIAVIGLGYVGLPLAVAFSEKYPVVGFDISLERVEELKNGYDRTLEVENSELQSAIDRGIEFTHNLEDIEDANVYIVTVPTPIDRYKTPDLTPLKKASEMVGSILSEGDIVIYESTVYPGCTEEVCVPILEKMSGLEFNEDFFVGYSPERINPGDKEHTIKKILKVTSGSTPEVAKEIDNLYSSIIEAGTHLAPSIKVAEAAKVIENAQRDINIAFVNELALLFDKLNIDTKSVLEAAGTKWNFLKFTPGLVGGHCIGVDPYYLTYKAKEVGYHPEIILAGRRLNDNMGMFVANKVVKKMIQKGHTIRGSRILVLGITFKEHTPDIRNSRVIDVIRELQDFKASVDVYDPWADSDEVKREYNLDLIEKPDISDYDGVVLAVAHREFKEFEEPIKLAKQNSNLVVYDIKSFFDESLVNGRL